MEFIKMHGLGNDYIFVDCLKKDLKDPGHMAEEMSRRHFSVGADGLILIQPSDIADFKMKMYNSDGSSGNMCGNGIRCLGKYVYEHGKTKKTELKIETDAGIRSLGLITEGEKVRAVSVDMGIPDFVPEHIPARFEGKYILREAIEAGKNRFPVTCLSVGNPHCVIFQEHVDDFNLPLFGPMLENHELFPDRINVEVAEIIDKNTIKMRVWERGSGETYACGTGACAVTAAAAANNLCGRRMNVILPGGQLNVYWNEKNRHIYLTGPAEEVYTGVWKPK